jgi:hypothetical protein
MAVNRQLYEDIPHWRTPQAKLDPTPHPYKATAPHEYWFIDGRQMDFALDGIKWWSIILLDGSQLGRVDGPLYSLPSLWSPPGPHLG